MTNRPKQIGTAFETMVTDHLRANGFPNAERRALAGAEDKGDILAERNVIVECKGGKAAESASDAQIETWLWETETERKNANVAIGMLVVKRKAHGKTKIGGMHAYLWLNMQPDGMELATLGWMGLGITVPVRLSLDDAIGLLRAMGYGEPPGGV